MVVFCVPVSLYTGVFHLRINKKRRQEGSFYKCEDLQQGTGLFLPTYLLDVPFIRARLMKAESYVITTITSVKRRTCNARVSVSRRHLIGQR
ncbi:hypothetical protein AV530_014754 [Patagioenas fasciata monilis]|uniref:Uncharacterized protein n=1 Tax=Patagioenas fasciata monilis TaxID=372326 RepID=A0A1V4L062_PATFA|nr:hypothetical protein AV530_014754 [Patagioenas fasciata monilis]